MSPREIWCNEAQGDTSCHLRGRSDSFRAICERERCPSRCSAPRPPTDICWSRTRPQAEARGCRSRDHSRQAAEDAARREARGAATPNARARGHQHERCGEPRALPSRRCEQDFPCVDRRPYGRRLVRARSFRRPVAGAGGRLRRHAFRLRGLRRRGVRAGERTPLALIDAPASGRMAVGEAPTNIAAAAPSLRGCFRRTGRRPRVPGEDAAPTTR